MVANRVVLVGLILAVAFGATGCGGSNDQTAEEMRIDREVAAAKESARQAQEISDLKKKLAGKSDNAARSSAPAAGGGSPTSDAGLVKAFHTRNVSCEVGASEAICTVNSTGEDFILQSGSSARTRFTRILAKGHGQPSAWGVSWSVGSTTCTVPRSDEARGIVCTDGLGHGFEASAVGSRAKTY